MDHFADRLTAAVRAKGNAVCVGLDPRWDALPQQIRNRMMAARSRQRPWRSRSFVFASWTW